MSIDVKAYVYGNTGNVEDDLDWSFRVPFVLTKGMKIRDDEVTYVVLDSCYNLDKGVLDLVLEIVP